MDDDKLNISGWTGMAQWGGPPEKLYVVAEDGGSQPEEVCTLSPDPGSVGWNTDLGFSGYGLPFDIAREIAKRYNEARWIPVEERLPEEGQEVVIHYFVGKRVARFFPPNLWRTGNGPEDYVLGLVERWFTLPAPPETAR